MLSPAELKLVNPSADVLTRAREVIELEAHTLRQLAAALGNTFVSACNLLHGTDRRIVVVGIGKSGHIARKIAATLSATGSPAIYVHPSEAAHGDLGMIIPGDVMLVISNSGNTQELRVMLDHARNLGVPVVGMTSGRGSLVARLADVHILMPTAEEACPVNIAPTSSTAQQLALGDAIAMVLMDMRKVDRNNIKALHPGGMIGLRLTTVGEIMHTEDRLPLVTPDLPMDEVISKMTSLGFGIAGVVDAQGRLVGTITDGDIRRHFQTIDQVAARDVMNSRPKSLHPDMPAEDALRFLNDAKITCAFVVPDGHVGAPSGIIHVHDFLRLGLA